jgi:hypothetical protein
MGVAKSEQASKPIRFRRAALQFSIANSQGAHLGAELIVFLTQMPQSYIVIPEAPRSVHRPCRASSQRGYALDGPHADEPHLLSAPDLQREQQDLRRNGGSEES